MTAQSRGHYSYIFLLPALVIYGGLFLLPTIMSLFFSMTRWTLSNWYFTGLDNFRMFFTESSLSVGFKNTILYAVLTCGLKVVLGFLLGVFLCSDIRSKNYLRSVVFFPNLLSTIAVGITFGSLMHPSRGLINKALAAMGIAQPDWLGNVHLALVSVALVDVWKGVGIAMVIFIAGILSIPPDYFEAARLEGGTWVKFRHVILPMSRNATFTVILLSFIGGLRTFDLIWTMTHGGPGFASDVLTSVIYKEYQAGFYGLSTAGNVVLFILVTAIVYPLMRYFNRMELEL